MENLEVRSILQPITSNLETITQSLQLLEDQSSKLAAVDSLPVRGTRELQRLYEELQSHQTKASKEISDLRTLAKGIRPQVETLLRAGIKNQVRGTIETEVRRQVDEQITRYIPISPKGQIAESRKQLLEIKVALANSEARTRNATLDITNLYDSLAPILMDSGEKSEYYPADLASLFSYDVGSLKMLVRSYGLEEDDSVHGNRLRFLDFIGARRVYLDEGGFQG